MLNITKDTYEKILDRYTYLIDKNENDKKDNEAKQDDIDEVVKIKKEIVLYFGLFIATGCLLPSTFIGKYNEIDFCVLLATLYSALQLLVHNISLSKDYDELKKYSLEELSELEENLMNSYDELLLEKGKLLKEIEEYKDNINFLNSIEKEVSSVLPEISLKTKEEEHTKLRGDYEVLKKLLLNDLEKYLNEPIDYKNICLEAEKTKILNKKYNNN